MRGSDQELDVLKVDELIAELTSVHVAHWVSAGKHGFSDGLVVDASLANGLKTVIVGVEVDKLKLIAEFSTIHFAHWVTNGEH